MFLLLLILGVSSPIGQSHLFDSTVKRYLFLQTIFFFFICISCGKHKDMYSNQGKLRYEMIQDRPGMDSVNLQHSLVEHSCGIPATWPLHKQPYL